MDPWKKKKLQWILVSIYIFWIYKDETKHLSNFVQWIHAVIVAPLHFYSNSKPNKPSTQKGIRLPSSDSYRPVSASQLFFGKRRVRLMIGFVHIVDFVETRNYVKTHVHSISFNTRSEHIYFGDMDESDSNPV